MISALYDGRHEFVSDKEFKSDIETYPIGSIWWYSNPYTKKEDYTNPYKNHDFTTSRPVIIMGRDISYSNQIVVIQRTGVKTRPGYDTYFPDKGTPGKLIAGRVCPYDIKSVGKEYLTEMIGFLKPELFKEVQKAYAWHLGLSDEVPPYLLEDYSRSRKLNPITYATSRDIAAQQSEDNVDLSNTDDVIEEDTNPGPVKPPRYTSLTKEEKEMLIDLDVDGIVDKFHVSKTTAYRWKNKQNQMAMEKHEDKVAENLHSIALDKIYNRIAFHYKATPFQIQQLIKRLNSNKRLINMLGTDEARIFVQIPDDSAKLLNISAEKLMTLKDRQLRILSAEESELLEG